MNPRLTVAAILFFTGFGSAAMAAAPFSWPKGAKYAVSLTYDDSLQSQLKNAVPALNKAGLRGSFYLSGPPYADPAALAAWEPVLKAGHEIGSHSIKHPCPLSVGIPLPKGGSEAYDLAGMEKELVESRRILAKLGPKAGLTFAYPCGFDWVGPNKTSYRPLVARLFAASRNAWGGLADPRTLDLNGVTTVSGSRSAAELIADAEAAKKSGAWAVYLFHGVGGDYLDVSLPAHQALLDHLKAAKREVWVAPFGEVAAWVKAHRK